MTNAQDTSKTNTVSQTESVRVWDLPTRLFHWVLVLLLGVSWASGEFGRMTIHFYSGYTILTLVLFRLIWGVVGSSSAQFIHFVKPRAILPYIKGLIAKKPQKFYGHNPLGALAVIAFLALLFAMTGTGLFSSDDIYTQGPLADLVSSEDSKQATEMHHKFFHLLQLIAFIHVVAIIFYVFKLRDNLITPMITGDKPVDPDKVDKKPRLRASIPWALLVLIFSAGLVTLIALQA